MPGGRRPGRSRAAVRRTSAGPCAAPAAGRTACRRAAQQEPAPHVRALGHRVEPRLGVRVVLVVVLQPLEHVVEVGGLFDVGDEVGRLDAVEADLRAQDDPVRPMPPVVARKSSRSGPSGVSVRICPSAVSRSSDSTWRVNVPCVWWLPPWMSAPIAPPTVTCRVPGRTGTHSPCGRRPGAACRGSSPRRRPRRPRRRRCRGCGRGGHVDDEPTRVLRRVTVGAAQTTRDDPARTGRADRLGDDVEVGGVQHRRRRRGRATPAGEALRPALGPPADGDAERDADFRPGMLTTGASLTVGPDTDRARARPGGRLAA